MSQREGETDYKHEDYASEMATYRNPQTDAMVKKQLKITLDSGIAFDLSFIERNKVEWKSSSASIGRLSGLLTYRSGDFTVILNKYGKIQ